MILELQLELFDGVRGEGERVSIETEGLTWDDAGTGTVRRCTVGASNTPLRANGFSTFPLFSY